MGDFISHLQHFTAKMGILELIMVDGEWMVILIAIYANIS